MNRDPITPATEPVGPDGFTLRERAWLKAASDDMAELNDLLAERGSGRRFGIGPDTPPAPSPLWVAARRSAAWLDAANGASERETQMRLMKISEELGEVMQAYIGAVGQNPRKGITHKPEDVAAELCDVIMSAAVALHRFADSPEQAMAEHAAQVVARIEALTTSPSHAE
ncbi:MazG-like family protein [Streptomyces sp. NEAU-174]|uniref:MazG-like family protein n=1 Tax=Streptomyces sp. NEAU-174 TaxID=3458254 RepID=UPI0040450AF2